MMSGSKLTGAGMLEKGLPIVAARPVPINVSASPHKIWFARMMTVATAKRAPKANPVAIDAHQGEIDVGHGHDDDDRDHGAHCHQPLDPEIDDAHPLAQHFAECAKRKHPAGEDRDREDARKNIHSNRSFRPASSVDGTSR